MRLDLWAGAEIGKRENQEDWHDVRKLPGDDGVLYVVADGMGGHQAGEVASRLAGSAFVERFLREGGTSVPARLMAAVQAANEAVSERIRLEPKLDGMGTTLLAACAHNGQLYWVSVGDSRLLHFSGGKLSALNADHSYGAWLDAEAAAGRLDPKWTASHPDRHSLMSCITGDAIELVEVSEKPVGLAPGDVVLAASDGIDTLRPDRLEALMSSAAEHSAAQTGRILMEAVGDAGYRHQDNTTLIVMKVG